MSARDDTLPMAIVGFGAVFPGPSTLDGPDGLDSFWGRIAGGVSAAREVPEGRWVLPRAEAFDRSIAMADRVYATRGCFVDDAMLRPDEAAALAVDPLLLAALDPMFHLALRSGLRAWRDARLDRLPPEARRRTSVVLGNIVLPTEHASLFAEAALGRARCDARRAHPLDRYVAGFPAGLLARALGLGGGAFALDAACASSLYALKLAADDLRSGRVDVALAGGLSRPDCLYTQMGFSQLRALSPTGRCSPFDARADGLVVGEGAGIVVLKRLEDALRDGDRIDAVIRGIGLSNDVGGSLMSPDSEGQLRALREAYRRARLRPDDIDLIECHGTGTPVGDAIELASLDALRNETRAAGAGGPRCVLSSVKSNVGHLLTAAGAAGLVKVLLAMRHRVLPPTAGFESPAPGLAKDGSPFEVLSRSREWARRSETTPRRAAVSAFGFGGINAHVILEEWDGAQGPGSDPGCWTPAPLPRVSASLPAGERGREPVAIIGMDAHFGPWNTLRAFQERVLGGGLDAAPEEIASSAAPDSRPIAAHAIESFEVELDRFRIPPQELREMLPQQILMLQVAARAVDDARLNGADRVAMGVFIGIALDLNTTNFHLRWTAPPDSRDLAPPPLTANRTMGALGGIVASRVARFLRAGGPSFTVSSEETSGLRALEIAVRALQDGGVRLAVAGAVDLAADLRALAGTDAVRAYSRRGAARPFDESADGAVAGEGAAAVVLKRLEDALRDKDRVYAVIRGVGSSSDGGGTAKETRGSIDRPPAEEAYRAALERAYEDARVDPATVGCVEAHGSGHPGEDAVEATALAGFFGAVAGVRHPLPCALSSAKADVGHAGAAAGMASLVKAALCLHHEVLPAVRGTSRPAGALFGGTSRLYLPLGPQSWLRDRALGPRRAGVSGMGIDGSCIHAVLEAVEPVLAASRVPAETAAPAEIERRQPLGARREAIFAVHGDDAQELSDGLKRLQAYAGEAGGIAPRHAGAAPVAAIELLARRWLRLSPPRPEAPLAAAIVARDAQTLSADAGRALGALGSGALGSGATGRDLHAEPGRSAPAFFFAATPRGGSGSVAFVFPGSGSQFVGMARELSADWPEVLRALDRENARLSSQMAHGQFWNGWSRERPPTDHRSLILAQVATGALICDLVRSFGVSPGAVIGYSLGESAGLFALRGWTDRDEMLRRVEASSLFTEDLAGPCRAARRAWGLRAAEKVEWTAGVLDRPAGAVRESLRGRARAYLLIVNTPLECVVGGSRREVESLVKDLGCDFVPLDGVTTVHCDVARQVEAAYRDLHLFETTPPAGVRFYSGARGCAYHPTRESAADSILAQALDTLDFTRVIETAYADGVRVFLEMGPGRSATRMISRILEGRTHAAFAACPASQGGTGAFLRFLAQCIAERVPVDLENLYGRETLVVGHREEREESERSVMRVEAHPPVPRSPEAVAEMSGTCADALPVPRSPEAVAEMSGIYADALPVPRAPAMVAEIARTGAYAVPATHRGFGAGALAREMVDAAVARARAHGVFLRLSAATLETASRCAKIERLHPLDAPAMGEPRRVTALVETAAVPLLEREQRPGAANAATASHTPGFLTREACLEFATGSIEKVLGRAFAAIDAHPTRVRLPDEPLMLVDRILEVEGKPLSMAPGRVVTEHEVLRGAWYLDCGRIPVSIAVEAGQADLFLSGYLGIDLETKGLAVYRLLDAAVTFHRGLPGPGSIIRYDIRIDRFFHQGGARLFRFHFEATVDGDPLLSMRDGCAGFFSAAELAAGKGIVHASLDLRPGRGVRPGDWRELVPMEVERYGERELDHLRAGDLAGCFGSRFAERFAALGLSRPVTLPSDPSGRMRLVHRVERLEPAAGRYGLGLIRGEADIHPGDWFLECHFTDDRVMPGTLMYECCLHTLRIYLLRMGWIGEDGKVSCEPVPGVSSRLKCRGQVTGATRRVTYEIALKEIGYRPEPYAIADALIYADGKPIVEMTQMSLQLAGLTREGLEAMWTPVAAACDGAPPACTPAQPVVRPPALFGRESILAFAAGKPSEAFGDRYKVFDSERVIARLPGPPYQFLDRIVRIEGCAAWRLAAGGEIEAEYDVPPGAWYFDANRSSEMPFAVLLEVALQPCGWLAAYLGSALTSASDLSFRNLGGKATPIALVTRSSGTLSTRVKITNVSSSGGMIIQHFDFEVRSREGLAYRGDTYFGFFSKEALAQQVGIRGGERVVPSGAEIARARGFAYPEAPPFPDARLRMVDAIEAWVPDGGPSGLGFIRGVKRVRPDEWFFQAHFYQDPVWPGSLGLEAFLQVLKAAAAERWGRPAATGASLAFEAPVLGDRHEWIYRGQVLPASRHVAVEAVIERIDDRERLLVASGLLIADGRAIYQMRSFGLRMPRSPECPV